MTDLSTHNHVVRSKGVYGTWGRGRTEKEARKNADLKSKDNYTLFIFKDDTWDIFDDGRVTWQEDGLIEQIERNKNNKN